MSDDVMLGASSVAVVFEFNPVDLIILNMFRQKLSR